MVKLNIPPKCSVCKIYNGIGRTKYINGEPLSCRLCHERIKKKIFTKFKESKNKQAIIDHCDKCRTKDCTEYNLMCYLLTGIYNKIKKNKVEVEFKKEVEV
jgi:hypothetical protein